MSEAQMKQAMKTLRGMCLGKSGVTTGVSSFNRDNISFLFLKNNSNSNDN